MLTNKGAILVVLDDLMDAGAVLSTKKLRYDSRSVFVHKKAFRILYIGAWMEYGVGEDSGRAAGAGLYNLNVT